MSEPILNNTGSARVAKALRRLQPRSLFLKYAMALVSLVVFVLVVTGALETWIVYQDTTTTLTRVQLERATAIAKSMDDAFSEIERQVSRATRASATTLELKRADYIMLLRQVPSIAEFSFIDGNGREQLRVSRTSISDGDRDYSLDPAYSEAVNWRVRIGPTSFVGDDAFVVMSMAHSGFKAGVTIARIDVGALTPLVDPTPLAPANYAYVVGSTGRVLIASKTSAPSVDLTTKPHIGAPLRLDNGSPTNTGRAVIGSSAPIERLGWSVVVEQSTKDALQPVSSLLFRLAWLILLGLVLAALAALLLARHMIVPIRALHAGAAQFAGNRFDHRITVGTGDELEELAQQFNRMADELAGSYARLEAKVEERTRDLARSVRDLQALEQIGRALASSLQINAVMAAIVSSAVELTKADSGAIFEYETGLRQFKLVEAEGFPASLRSAAAVLEIDAHDVAFDQAMTSGAPISIRDLGKSPRFPLRDATVAAGFNAVLVIPLVGSAGAMGALVLYKKAAEDFPLNVLSVMQTFANQSVLALQNARLFQEVIDKGDQLEIANAHRTQFFANMSHELRTPLNAVLGYSELLYDGLYGTLPDRALGVLDRIQVNGKHLLGLINDILDLTKMEAGALDLTLSDYAMDGLIDGVMGITESLAKTKGIAFVADVPKGLPIGRGDDKRLTQVLLNLVGNAIKFTDEGEVRIEARVVDEGFKISVHDTGPGIAAENLEKIFDEFQQVDDANTRKNGGTGLGLSISKHLVAMHGGSLTVQSVLDVGSVFSMIVPVRVADQRAAA